MTHIEFVSNVGGLLGLFIGFSLISGIEIVYWMTIGYGENSYAYKKQRQKSSKISVVSPAASDKSKKTPSTSSAEKDKVVAKMKTLNMRPNK